MLPVNRRQQILELLHAQGSVQIPHLSHRFAVSAMTIHRDLDRLAAQGKLRKVRGGAVLPETAANAEEMTTYHRCATCYTTPRRHLHMILHLEDGRNQHACCPHCGLMQMVQAGEQVRNALVTDFLQGHTISAKVATYVVDPEITICCTPTTIAFQQETDARRFQKGFGGQIFTLAAAIEYIQEAMLVHRRTP